MALYVCKIGKKVTRGQSTNSETFAKKNNCKKYVLFVSKTTLRTARFIENTNTVWIVFQEKY